MKYIVATTDNDYFRWQMLVQINNFKKWGILDDLTYVVSVNHKISAKLNKIKKETGVRIETYRDQRGKYKYASSIRPHILKKHFQKFPKEAEQYYYLDPDVLFTKKPEYVPTYYSTKRWILSDTKSYIDSRYIKSKSEELFELMCEKVGVDPQVVTKNDNSAGGAQYIIKNAGAEYWEKVEKDSESLYKLMINTSKTYNPEHPIQAWTADMWAVLWNAWYFGHKTIVDSRMDFCWATDPIKRWEEKLIFHNAGVFDQKNLFNKGSYSSRHPFDVDLSFVSKDYCSSKYVEEIEETKNNYTELIKSL